MADTVTDGFDLVVVGAGIVGLAHALAVRRLVGGAAALGYTIVTKEGDV
jgi:cation diffusion facilitator CzcD-associated flavoprotein CzcO